MKLILTLQKLL